MTTRLLLVKPDVKYPVKKQGSGGDVGVPLGLLYLGAYARQYNDVEVRVKDYRLDHALGKPRNLEQDFNRENIIGTGACTAESPDALNILKQAKKQEKITVMGGLYSTFNIDSVLNTGHVDYVVRGEGEKGLSNLLRALEGKISLEEAKGISYKKDGRIVHNPDQPLIEDLDSLPMPAYDLIPVHEYIKFGSAPIYSARGCPLTCKFCTLNEMWRFKHRARSFDNILQEIEMVKSFGFKRAHFKDETLTINRKRAIGLFKEIERANLGLSYKGKSRINNIDEEIVQQGVRAGLDTIHTGVESISQETLRRMGKGVNVNSVRRAFDIVLNNGANINPVYMFSWIGETEQDLLDNSRFIKEMGQRKGVITYISFTTPHPGSGIENEVGLEILTKDYSRYTHKQPVAVPRSLGKNGLRLMVDQYHGLAESIGMQHVNPQIDPQYLNKILTREMKGGLEIAA